MESLTLALMVWASAYTGLPMTEVVPHVIHRDRCTIQAMFNAERPCDETGETGAQALYQSGTIVMGSGWDAGNLGDVAALLHEVVHHLQFEAGLGVGEVPACNFEGAAYDAQRAFLQAAGDPTPLATIGVNELYLIGITSCPLWRE